MSEQTIEARLSAHPSCADDHSPGSISVDSECPAVHDTVAVPSGEASAPLSEAESSRPVSSGESAPPSAHLVTYVAPNIEALIKKSSESASTSRSSSFGSPRRLVEVPPVDPHVLDDLERDTRLLADSVAHMLGSITISMHNTCRDAVDKTCDTLDASVEVMNALLIKCEELGRLSLVINPVAKQIKDIRRMLDLFEQQLLHGAAKSN